MVTRVNYSKILRLNSMYTHISTVTIKIGLYMSLVLEDLE